MNPTFEMVAKTFQGLEGVLADELRALGAEEVEPGKRMVSFRGDLEMMYRANMCCRTALRILKPFCTFEADDPDELYMAAKRFDWGSLMSVDKTFSIDSTVFSDDFRNSQYVTYRVKDALVDWFRDHLDQRPRVSVENPDVVINVHVAGRRVTLSLDSSGESLHKRGWRTAQTEAPINEVLAAGIILMSGYKGDTPFVDPMCGSGTFVIEAAMIAAGIWPGIYRKHFAFENWPDFDAALLEKIYNDDSAERPVTHPIIGADIAVRAIDIARTNARSAGVAQYITFETKAIADWTEAPAGPGIVATNPPYGHRIGSDDMDALYASIGTTFKHVFNGYNCWVISTRDEFFDKIGLAPSQKVDLFNGGIECRLREYVIFSGNKKEFRASGGKLRSERPAPAKAKGTRPRPGDKPRADRKPSDRRPRPERPDFKRPDFKRPDYKRGIVKPRRPSLPPESEVVIERPMWRTRRKHDDNTPQNNDNQ